MTSKILLGATAVAALSLAFAGSVHAQSRSRAAAPAAAAPARAAGAPAAAPPAPWVSGPAIPGICVFSEGNAVSASKAGQAANSRVQELKAQVQAELQPEATSLQNDLRTFQAQRATLTGDALAQRQQSLQGRAEAFQAKEQLRNQELQATIEKALTRIRIEMEPVVRQTYESRKCSILLNADQGVFVTAPGMDISAAVKDGLDAKLPTISFDREHIDPAAAQAPQR